MYFHSGMTCTCKLRIHTQLNMTKEYVLQPNIGFELTLVKTSLNYIHVSVVLFEISHQNMYLLDSLIEMCSQNYFIP